MNQEQVRSAIELVQAQIGFTEHSLEALERGLIPFATTVGKDGRPGGQVGLLNGLLRQCSVPDNWRLWMVGQFMERELRSTKDISLYEASALISFLLDGSDGQGQAGADPDGPKHPCREAVEVIGWLLDAVLAQGVVRAIGGRERVEVIQQLGFA